MNSSIELDTPTYACRGCGATHGQHACGRERFLDVGQYLYRCDGCGLAYLAPDFTDAALNLFYAEHYRTLFLFDVTRHHDALFFKHTLYREAALARATLLATRLPPSARVLEIGSGFGAFLGQLHALRPDIVLIATETDATHRTMLLDSAQVHFIDPTAIAAHGPFDAVVAFHILEHLKQPVASIAHYARTLTAAGILVIEVPDASAPWGSWFDVQSAHVSYFTRASLTRVLQRAGVPIGYVGAHPGGAAFTFMIWAIAQKGTGAAHTITPTTPEENASFAAHIARYPYCWKQRWRKHIKRLAVLLIGPYWLGALQRKKVYRTQRHLYADTTVNRR
jgi:SAM-dependent methyltransferase